MTKAELAHVCAELTDNLPSKVRHIGVALTAQMAQSNQCRNALHCGDLAYAEAEAKIDGILTALSIMSIPYTLPQQDERGKYVAIEIAGETFYVDASSDADAADSGKGGE